MVLCLQSLRETLTTNTKFLLLNTPSSPLGKVFSKEELEGIAGVVREFPNLMVLSDEVYEHMVFEGLQHEHFASLEGMFDRTVTLFSVGKTFSCTGWRLGYAIGPAHMINPIKALHAAVNFSTATPFQKATARAFTHADRTGYFEWLPKLLEGKRDKLTGAFGRIGMQYIQPQGGYFVVCDYHRFAHLASIRVGEGHTVPPDAPLEERPDVRFSKWLTAEVGVAPIPMSPFYPPEQRHFADGLIRFAYCKDEDTLNTAIERLEAKLLM